MLGGRASGAIGLAAARQRVPAAVVAAVLLTALSSPNAHAAAVRIEPASETFGHMVEPVWRTVVFEAGPGESNRITVTTTKGNEVTVRDDANPLAAPSECTRVDDHTVRCKGGPFEERSVPRPQESHDLARADLGDGDDTAVAAGEVGVRLAGGAGDDRLTGGPGHDVLADDAGRNELSGGPANDVLIGGPAGDADVFDGGDGSDTIRYATRKPVIIDLSRGVAGVVVARDRVQHVEDASGGSGDDTLIGDDGANRMVAGTGSDRLDGRGGRDDIELQAPVSDPSAELVPEFLDAPDRRRDVVSCGDARDRVDYPDLADRLTACEVIGAAGGWVAANPARIGARRVIFRTQTAEWATLGLRLTARSGGRPVLLGQGVDRRKTNRIVLSLTRAGRRFVARRGRHGVRAEALSDLDEEGVPRSGFRMKL